MDCHKQYRNYLKPKERASKEELAAMKPQEEDKLSTLMDRGWDNLRYMMYGLINYDDERMKTATANLMALSEYMAKRISPVHKVHEAEWNEQCNRQGELALNISREFEQENFAEAGNQVTKLIENCMECHIIYRKHLLKPTQ